MPEQVETNDDQPAVPRMPESSRFSGQPIDVSSRRSIRIRFRPNQKTIEPSDQQVTLDYFFHHGQFWTAVVPLDEISEVFGQVFNFSSPRTRRGKKGIEIRRDKRGIPKRKLPGLNHVQSRVKLQAGRFIDLHPLGGEPTGAGPIHRINDFVFSLEVAGPAGESFNLRDALFGNFISAHRMMSTEEMVFERLVTQDQVVIQSPPLPLDPPVKRKVLVETLMRSHNAGMAERYYLFRLTGTNNCTSNPFIILDGAMDYNFLQRIGSFLYRLPINPRLYLWLRGLDSDPSTRLLVAEEFADYINSPEVQQRKLQYREPKTAAESA